MKVLVLGGYGHYGHYISRRLAERDIVTNLVVAGRSLEKAQAFADELGSKAEAGRVDLSEDTELPESMRDADLIVNVAGPDHLMAIPALRLAISAGVNYCDLNISWRATEEALAMRQQAKDAGITAIIGIGAFPGLFSLLAMHGVGCFDQAKAVRIGYSTSVQAVFGDPHSDAVQNVMGSALEGIIHGFTGTVRQFADGSHTDIVAMGPAYKLPLLGGSVIEVHAQGSAEPITMPESIPGIEDVTIGAGLYPPQVNDLIKRHIDAHGPGEEAAVVAAIRKELAADPDRWTAEDRDDVTKGEAICVEGIKDGRRARCLVEPNWNGAAFADDASGDVVSAGPLLVACLKLLSGEIAEKGVLSPEQCFTPEALFEGLRREVNLFSERDGSLVTQQFEFLN